jgi:hypothetical protein
VVVLWFAVSVPQQFERFDQLNFTVRATKSGTFEEYPQEQERSGRDEVVAGELERVVEPIEYHVGRERAEEGYRKEAESLGSRSPGDLMMAVGATLAHDV